MIKKIFTFILILIFLNSCLVLKIQKDSPPLIDAGAPIIGHFRNKDRAKAILYTTLFISCFVATFLFAPTTDNGSIIPIDRSISDPLFYSFLGSSVSTLIASSVDTSVTYHLVNKKIIELNDIYWKPFIQTEIKFQEFEDDILGLIRKRENRDFILAMYQKDTFYNTYLLKSSLTQDEEKRIRKILLLIGYQSNSKYDTIADFRKKDEITRKNEKEKKHLESLKAEIEYYRKQLLDKTITEDELLFLEKSDKMKEILKNEMGYYYISKQEDG